MPGQPSAKSVIGSILLTRIVQVPLFIGALLAIYTEGATAYLNTQKAIEAKAVADNAVLKQKSEGGLAEQKARTELETARNATARQSAETDKSEAEALKAQADAITARSTARNSELKTRADAQTIKAEAELRRQKVIVALETARNAARRQQAETGTIEAKVAIKRQANAILKHNLDVTDCSKSYRSTNFMNDFTDIMARRIACGN